MGTTTNSGTNGPGIFVGRARPSSQSTAGNQMMFRTGIQVLSQDTDYWFQLRVRGSTTIRIGHSDGVVTTDGTLKWSPVIFKVWALRNNYSGY